MSEPVVVIVPTGEAQIWDKDKVIVEIASAMAANYDIVLDCIGEGPCLKSVGLYQILDLLSDKFNYSKKRILIVVCNQLEQHSEYSILVNSPLKHVGLLQLELKNSTLEYKSFNNKIKHFGNFVSRGSRDRLLIGSYLYSNYKDKTLQTYHCNIRDDYHKASIFFDELLWANFPIEYVDDAYEFLTRSAPIKFAKESIETYPIRDYKMYGINEAYPEIFVDIVCQTYCRGRTFYIDEKIWRPIMTKTPFIVQGSSHFIKNLQRLGFKTFNQWWDENYSEAPWNEQTLQILKIIDRLAKLSIVEIEIMYNDMKSILDYNYEKFANMSNKDFENFRNNING